MAALVVIATMEPAPAERDFTTDWVTSRERLWREHVFKNLPPEPESVHYLEIGCFEGRNVCFTHDNLTSRRPGSSITCVDPWQWDPNYERRFDANCLHLPDLTKVKNYSANFFRSCNPATKWDLIYIDGDHRGRFVLQDSVLAWEFLRSGGILVWDDYLLEHPPRHAGESTPREAIDGFMLAYRKEIRVLCSAWQMYVQKK